MRRVLYIAALVATRHNQRIKSFYQRLLAKGKPKKLALLPAMRIRRSKVNRDAVHQHMYNDDIDDTSRPLTNNSYQARPKKRVHKLEQNKRT